MKSFSVKSIVLSLAIVIGTLAFFAFNQLALPKTPDSDAKPPIIDNNNSPIKDNTGSTTPSTIKDPTTPDNNTDKDPVKKPPAVKNASVIRQVSTQDKTAILTFDAGSDRGFAANILDILGQYNVKATFGMTGKWAEQNPDLVKRIANGGHDFINHTYSHESLTGFSTNKSALSKTRRLDELSKTEAIISQLTGKYSKPYFRPPYGDYDTSVNQDIASAGYNYNIMWTVDSLGWKGLTAQQIRERVVEGTVPGAIHLFHVGEQSQDAAALPLIISDLQSKGYTFARISDLIK